MVFAFIGSLDLRPSSVRLRPRTGLRFDERNCLVPVQEDSHIPSNPALLSTQMDEEEEEKRPGHQECGEKVDIQDFVLLGDRCSLRHLIQHFCLESHRRSQKGHGHIADREGRNRHPKRLFHAGL